MMNPLALNKNHKKGTGLKLSAIYKYILGGGGVTRAWCGGGGLSLMERTVVIAEVCHWRRGNCNLDPINHLLNTKGVSFIRA